MINFGSKMMDSGVKMINFGVKMFDCCIKNGGLWSENDEFWSENDEFCAGGRDMGGGGDGDMTVSAFAALPTVLAALTECGYHVSWRKYVVDAVCFVYACRRLIDLSLLAGTMPVSWWRRAAAGYTLSVSATTSSAPAPELLSCGRCCQRSTQPSAPSCTAAQREPRAAA